MSEKTPWKNGMYFSSHMKSQLIKVDGNDAVIHSVAYLEYPEKARKLPARKWKFGDFGPARKEVRDAANGIENYNICIRPPPILKIFC